MKQTNEDYETIIRQARLARARYIASLLQRQQSTIQKKRLHQSAFSLFRFKERGLGKSHD